MSYLCPLLINNLKEYSFLQTMRTRTPPYLQRLASELTDTLRVIVYTNKQDDEEFIRTRQAELREIYGSRVSDGLYERSAQYSAEVAYALFMHILDDNKKPEDIGNACQDILTNCFRL